jgi:hypothetical protein
MDGKRIVDHGARKNYDEEDNSGKAGGFLFAAKG